jgi:DNA invertase Pin-like site-specific DNA recombinase
MTTALAYLRVSGAGQNTRKKAEDVIKDGFTRQRLAIEAYAAQNGFKITQWFEDVQTGKDEWQDRPGWSAMMAALNGTRTLIVEKLDRVARVVLVQELILADLKKRDVRLLTTAGDDTDDATPERELFRVMLAGFAQYERHSICLKLRGARQRKKDETGRCEGRKPYGGWPGEDETLELMRKYRTAGHSFADVAVALNQHGKLTRYKKPWRGETIQKILSREL